MTDKEIIKALECCANGEQCVKCPLADEYANCKPIDYALDLIKRRQKQIDALNQVIRGTEKNTYIEIGDKVIVADTGYCYPRYDEWIKENVADYSTQWCYGTRMHSVYDCLDNCVFTVVAKAPHQTYKEMLCLIQDQEGRCFIVAEKGLQKVKL